MQVNLLDYNPNALDILLYTKHGRLSNNDDQTTLADISEWPMEKKLEHLDYMRKTIKSSWEFVDYTFEIRDVSRVFTHQLVRTRQASYAQQSQRTVEALPDVVGPDIKLFEEQSSMAFDAYYLMIDRGIPRGEARYILPMGTATNIIMKVNLRTLHEMAKVRLCFRTAGEYQRVFKEMVARVVDVHPYFKDFMKVACAIDGICAFPNYKECPVQPYTIMPEQSWLQTIEDYWEKTEHVANPVAKNGKTM